MRNFFPFLYAFEREKNARGKFYSSMPLHKKGGKFSLEKWGGGKM
jgi:hypothetical protein